MPTQRMRSERRTLPHAAQDAPAAEQALASLLRHSEEYVSLLRTVVPVRCLMLYLGTFVWLAGCCWMRAP